MHIATKMTKEKNKNKKNIGIKKEVEILDGVTASLNNHELTIKGPKGEVKREIKYYKISIKIEEKKNNIWSG